MRLSSRKQAQNQYLALTMSKKHFDNYIKRKYGDKALTNDKIDS